MGPRLHDLDRINEELAERIDDLVPRLFVNAQRDKRYFELGSIAGDPGRSLKIWRTGPKRGEWCDFAQGKNGVGGKPLALVIASDAAGKGDPGAGIRWAAQWLGIGVNETVQERAAREEQARKLRERKARQDAEHAEKLKRAAKALFLASAPVAGTLADVYLREERKIDLRALGRQPGALRFHGALKCPESARERPGLIGCVDGEAGFMTVHRTFLYALPDGRVVKADDARVPEAERMADSKQTYSARMGGMIPIWRGESGKPRRDMPDGEWIALSEGIEDALSIAIADPSMRVGCVIALNGLGPVWLPKQCGGIYWHRHRGDGPEALAALESQYQMLRSRGLAFREAWAPEGAKDFNAWLQEQG